ncbi:hypothetical protein CVT26_011686 [Gymnopilus dilepis]|uniref:Uncharacterized protein n=1 Tax=Gymnopilus dilepis TaxID=231916 RepID=A0A409W904_9AGAR|nr:hypothetical protein CVT26_011686 [Gymnopilus dilepis]
MFSSLLPNVASNMKFTQNGAGKPSNRFSVRVFKTGNSAPFPYPLNTKPDLTYRAPPAPQQPLQQPNANWYNNAPYNTYDHQPQAQAQRPRTVGSANGGGGFSIYPSATGDTFIYEQSSCSKSDIFSNSELDSPTSTATISPNSFFSPALSTDSTLTLVTEPDGTDPASLDPQQLKRERSTSSGPVPPAGPGSGPSAIPVARAPSRSGFGAAPQGPPPVAPAPPVPLPPVPSNSLNKTASLSHHHPYPAQQHMHEAQAEALGDQQLRGRQTSLPVRSTTPFRVPGSGPGAPVGVVPVPMPPPQQSIAAAMARVPSIGGSGMSVVVGPGVSIPIGGGMSMGPGGVIQVPEYEPSTFSEMEVLERDRIAKINAEYNAADSAASAAAYFATGAIPAPEAAAINMRQMSTSPTPRPGPMSVPMPVPMPMPTPGQQTSPTSGREYVSRVASSSMIHDSPPRVERLPSVSAPTYPAQPHPTSARPRTPSPRQQHLSPTTASTPYINGQVEQFDVGSAPSSRSTYATSAPGAAAEYYQERDRERDRGRDRSPPSDSRRRRSSLVGPRPDLSSVRQSSDIRDYGLSDYRQQDIAPPRASSDPSSSTTRDRERDRERSRDWERDRERDRDHGYSRDRRDGSSSNPAREVSPNTSPRQSSRNPSSIPLDIRRDSRPPDDYRASPPSRRNSAYVSESPTSPRDGRGQYKSGPLSSSPIQMRPVPDSSENERSRGSERTRTRSNSFSASTRPPMPVQMPASDSRYTSEQERSRRGAERPSYKDDEPSSSGRRPSRAEPERRGSTDYFSSSHAHYSQTSTIPLPTTYDGPSSHHLPPPSSSRAVEHSFSSQHARSQSRPPASHEPASASRTRAHDYHSDGERPYHPTTSHYPAMPYDKRPNQTSSSAAKYVDPSSGRETPRTGTPTYPPGSEPTQRRYSDGDQKPPVKNQISGKTSTPALRCVRWNENLICPSPVFSHQRRKGWFNRKGDQLWTNDGQYKSAPAGQEYPPDLADYPEEGHGWMNEEGIRIDLTHRLVPKAPLRPALKQTRIA